MSNTVADQLKALIDSDENTELQCRYYLQYAKYLLVNEHPDNFCYIETERSGHLGRSDYVISCTVSHGGETCVRAYIWELKAPQVYIFETNTHTRLKPSAELSDAQNKLLHYYYENKYNGLFHQQYGLSHPAPENVCLGGIIIGCDRTKVRGSLAEEDKLRLYQTTKTALNFLYAPAGIRLKTWDDIYIHIRSAETVGREFVEQPIEIAVPQLSPSTISVSGISPERQRR